VGQLNEKNQKHSQVTNPLCENYVHFTVTQMARLQYPCGQIVALVCSLSVGQWGGFYPNK
jgi:hypothetical protein